VAGAWNGGRTSTIGLYNPTTSTFYLHNFNGPGTAENKFSYGPAGSNWTPMTGNWLGIGMDTVGMYNPASSTFYLRYSNSPGPANSKFVYGTAGGGWTPLSGNWQAASSLLATTSITDATNVSPLSDSDLQPVVHAAIDRWAGSGLNASLLQKLQNTHFVIADLSGSHLGQVKGNVVYLDINAAGHGWFVDTTPSEDSEYVGSV
jgi:hypothetical protein